MPPLECPLVSHLKRLSLAPALSHPRYHLCRDSVIIKERLGPRKLHGITLDEDEMNPLGSIIKQLRPARDPLVIPRRGTNRTIEVLSAPQAS